MISCSRQDSRYAPHIDQDASGRMLHKEREREKHFRGVYIMYIGDIDIYAACHFLHFCAQCRLSQPFGSTQSRSQLVCPVHKKNSAWCFKSEEDASTVERICKIFFQDHFCLKKVTLVEFPFCKMLQVAMRTAPALPSLVRNLRFQCGLFFFRPDELPDCYKQACGIV